MNGDAVARDYREAAAWFRRAVEQDLPLAQFNLGILYSDGRGVPQDDISAHMWLNIAAAGTTGEVREMAVRARDEVAARMTFFDRSEAQRLAREWDAAHR